MLQRACGEVALEENGGCSEPPEKGVALQPARSAETSADDERADDSRPVPEFTERELVERARLGDAVAFGQLIGQHYKMCLKRASSLIRNPSDAEDEVQNACWKAFERLSQFRGEGSFSAWLGRIVENQCLMRRREERRAHFLYLDQTTDPDANVRMELIAQVPGPEDELGDEQVITLLQKEISRIPPLLRNAMVLTDIERLPMPDVAKRLGISIPAAKSRLGRARAELRARLKKYCGRRGFSTLTYKPRYARLAYTRGA